MVPLSLRDLLTLVLLSVSGAWKLTDFDFTMTGGSRLAYSTNSAYGTDCYRAPELVKENSKVAMMSDIWALGCIMYEVLTGDKRFPQDFHAWRYYSSKSEVLSEPPLPYYLCVQLRESIRLLLENALAREWWKRPSAAEVLLLLDLATNATERPTQVYFAKGGTVNMGRLIWIDHDSELWNSVRWEQYWFFNYGTF